MAKVKLSELDNTELAAHLKEVQLNAIDVQLGVINKRLQDFEPLVEHRNRLQAARRALLNDRAVASGGGRGLSQAEVVNALRELGSATVYELAQKLGAGEAPVRSHLNRGKDERFTKLADNKWELREPEDDEDDDDE